MDILKKEIKIDRKIVIMFVIFNFLIMGLYYTYSIFVIRQLKDDISLISVRTNKITMSSATLTNNQVTVASGGSTDVSISLTNTSSQAMYYRILHEGVATGVAVYEKNSDNTSWGMIEAGATIACAITVNNTTGTSSTVTFYVQESTEEYFDKEEGYSYVNTSISFDHSGASEPFMPNNMIPVYYEPASSATSLGVWKKADENNATSDYIWYDYDNFMWANAVTVTSTNRDTYIAAEPGTEIANSDINAFFVWIPEYKYNIVSANGNTSYERLINVNFLNRRDISEDGTVECVESISTKDNPHLYSEICTDNIYGEVQNNLSTYHHPSFASDTTSYDGFWIGKFANRNYSSITIKNETYVANAGTAATTSYIRQMNTSGNAYGFAVNTGATYNGTTWLYTNQMSGLDIHPITSMEWGAVAILTNSAYGKSGNPMYSTDTVKGFSRVYNNASSGYTGRSTNYTTSSLTVNNTSTSTIYYYNLTDVTHTTNSVNYPIGYVGAGASTTGTIYGVYDMAGGNYTTVMGVVMNEDGTSPYSMDSAFYTAYSYIPYTGIINDSSNAAYLEVFRLGDGIKEHVRTYSEKGMWQNGTLTLNNTGLMRRGGYTTSGSLFTTEITNTTATYETFTVLRYKPLPV